MDWLNHHLSLERFNFRRTFVEAAFVVMLITLIVSYSRVGFEMAECRRERLETIASHNNAHSLKHTAVHNDVNVQNKTVALFRVYAFSLFRAFNRSMLRTVAQFRSPSGPVNSSNRLFSREVLIRAYSSPAHSARRSHLFVNSHGVYTHSSHTCTLHFYWCLSSFNFNIWLRGEGKIFKNVSSKFLLLIIGYSCLVSYSSPLASSIRNIGAGHTLNHSHTYTQSLNRSRIHE